VESVAGGGEALFVVGRDAVKAKWSQFSSNYRKETSVVTGKRKSHSVYDGNKASLSKYKWLNVFF
jgi:hypothetical protein